MRHVILTLSVSTLLCCTSSPLMAQATTDITRGDVAQFIGEAIPESPSGYDSFPEILAAIQTGREKVIDLKHTLRGVRVRREVTYGMVDGTSLKLDLYQPRLGMKPKGGLIFVHGGGWKHGSKQDYAYYGQVFAAKGYVLASIDYRLSGVAPFPAAVQDCHCAVRWLRSQAKSLNIDPQKIIIAGGSAGGHLALLTAYASEETALHGTGGHANFSSDVVGVVSIYGPTDLTQDFDRENIAFRLVEDFIGKSFASAPETYQLASPLSHVDKNDPPTLILHGTLDSLVPVAQSDRLAEKLDELNVPYVYDRLAGWDHAMDLSQRVNDRCVWMMDHFFQHVFDAGINTVNNGE